MKNTGSITILDSKPGHSPNTQVVLARFRGEYVTWVRNLEDDALYCGHYFATASRAIDDFQDRN